MQHPLHTLTLPIENTFRLKKTKTKQIQMSSHVQSSDESIDELAGEALLKIIPKRIATAASLRSELVADEGTRPGSNRSFHTANENLENPATDASRKTSHASEDRQRPVLAQRTTNLKVRPSRGLDGQIDKAKISPPTLQSSTKQDITALSGPTATQSAETMPLTQSTPRDPVELNRKISDLLKQAADQEAESEEKASILANELAKPSPRQRAKQAMAKASRAMKDKLSYGDRGQADATGEQSTTPYSIELSLEGDLLNDDPLSGTLSRRMAEGVNLSNPKIQSLVGTPGVPRKPLPIYESMKSRIQRSSFVEDPFQDGDESEKISLVKTQDHQSFHKFNLASHLGDLENQRKNSDVQLHQDSSTPRAGSKFSSEISGLAQHADTLYFSSSPDDTSTPQTKWKNRATDSWKSRSSMPITRKSDKATARASSGDEKSITPSTASKTVTDGSQSVKRKSAQENLRLISPAITKRPRTSRQSSQDPAAKLVVGMNSLDTQDGERSPLSSKITKANKQRPHQVNKRKGLAIFDVGKGKAPESREEEIFSMKRPQLKSTGGRRASFTRPHSILFGREPKTEDTRKFARLEDADDMEIDELAQ